MRRRWALGAFRTPRSAWPPLPPLTTSHFTLWRWSRGTKADNAAVPDHRSGRTTVLARWHNNESAVVQMLVRAWLPDDKSVAGRRTPARRREDELVAGRTTRLTRWHGDK